jgi:enoyl-CoA hydratase/carnithine racemase
MVDTNVLSVALDDGVAVVTLHHEPINLIDLAMFGALIETVGALAADDSVRAVVICSSVPDFFIAHFDVSVILSIPTGGATPTEPNSFQLLAEQLRTMPKLTMAVIEGRCGGGGSELALSCDMRVAGPNATFNQPEVALGILPGGSGTARLTALAGRAHALEVILGCEDVSASRAAEIGWVNRVEDDPLAWAMRFARRVASFPPAAVAAAKAAVLRAEGSHTALLVGEGTAFGELIAEPDTRAAMEQFLAGGGQTAEGERRLGSLFG